MPRLTRKAVERYGFSTAQFLTDWAGIVGPELAGYTAPECLKWPRRSEPEDDAGTGCARPPGATLVLRVEGARALDVQYRSRQIAERINAYFGYAAVAGLRLVQAPIMRPPPRLLSRIRPAVAPALAASVDLEAALVRLQASMDRRRNEDPAPAPQFAAPD